MSKIEYDPLPFQKVFHESRKPKVYLSAGYGAGKTYSLCMKLLQLAHLNRGIDGGILCPNLKMFKRDVWPTLDEIADEFNLNISFHRGDTKIRCPETDSEIFIYHNEDKGTSIRGANLAFMCINEVTLCNKETFFSAISRVRVKDAPLLQVAMSGTPESFNWAYEYFIESPRADTDLIYGDMRLNTHVDQSYVDMLTSSYDSKMAEQYVEGKFVNLVGDRAAYKFDRVRHVSKDVQRIQNLPVWVSVDFNISPMAATLWSVDRNRSKPLLHAYDEIAIDNSNTDELADVLRSKLGWDDFITLFPDPAGVAGSTKSKGKSDFAILKEKGFEDLRYRKSIRSVKDCLNALNRGFEKFDIKISPVCKNLISDLEQCIIKPGGFEIDKRDPRRTHWLDGMKNMFEYEFPIVINKPTVSQARIR